MEINLLDSDSYFVIVEAMSSPIWVRFYLYLEVIFFFHQVFISIYSVYTEKGFHKDVFIQLY